MSTAPILEQTFSRLYAVRIRMRFDQNTLAGTYHSPGVAGFLKRLFGGNLPSDLWLCTPDSGVPCFSVGHEYSFCLYALESGLVALESLLAAIIYSDAKRSAGEQNDARAFGPRWHFQAAEDIFADDARIGRANDLRPLSVASWQAEASLCNAVGQAWMRLLSPMQLLRAREERPTKGTARYCQDASTIDGSLLLDRLRQSFDAFNRRLGVEQSLPQPDACIVINATDLFWHGAQQLDADRNEKPIYGLGGVVGLEVTGADAEMVWQWLVLGQHLGIGQRRGFGLGRYRLEGPEGECIGVLPERRASLLSSAFSLPNLDAAWDAIRNNKRRAAFERELEKVTFGLPPDADQRTELARLAKCIVADDYDFPSLEGIIIDKPKGGQRALAVPPLLDRVLQRAVAQMLTRIIEPVMYARSYGYRPGRNRMQARDLIQRLLRDGYTWFFESDIDSFFDAVDHALIYNRLMSLLPDDPAVDRIMRWITAPVRYQGRLLQRGGLPQGSPLSPLLANLVLDDFDNDLVAAGFMPVRFADDFIVPCKSREEAERAAAVVLASLGEKGLALNDDQSRIARFADGLKFLGYRFLNDLAIETRKPRATEKSTDTPHSDSWLARIAEDDQAADSGQQHHAQTAASTTVSGIAEAGSAGSMIVVSEPGSVIYTRDGQLWCQHEEREACMIAPWPEIGGLVLLGYQRFTQAVLHRAMAHDVAVYFTDGFGRYKGMLTGKPAHDHRQLWLQQLAAGKKPQYMLAIARQLVAARLNHQIQVLRRRGISAATLRALKKQQEHAATAASLESLRGIEGSATRVYFAAIAALMPDWMGFKGRNRRPPRDPFNALLSLGYTLLYSHTATLLQVAGLMPEQGFYHQPRGRHAALASDMMEPFRHIVEATALAQVNRRQLRADDFHHDATGACRLGNSGRKLFLSSLSKRLAGAMTTQNGQSASGHEHMLMQATRLARSLSECDDGFTATRLK